MACWTTARPIAPWLLSVILVAIASHLFTFFASDYEPSIDAKEYFALGTSLSGVGELRLPDGCRAKRMPLWPATIALADAWQGRELLPHAIFEIQAVLSLMSVIFIALAAAKIAGPSAGLLAGLIAALYAPYRALQASYLCETMVIFLLTGAFLAYLSSLRAKSTAASWSALTAASIALGLAVLTRADAIVMAIPFAIDTLVRRNPIGVRIARASAILVCVIISSIAWGLRNEQTIGKFTLSTIGGLNFHLGNCDAYAENPGMNNADYAAFDRLRDEEGLSEVEADERLYAQGRQFLREHPGLTAANALRKTRVWFQSNVTWSAPTSLLLILWTLAFNGPHHARRFFFGVAAAWSLIWCIVLQETIRPWASPLFVVPLGLIGMAIMKDQIGLRRLLIGLVISQLAVAVVFIPLERLRWTIDWVFIIAIAAATARFCDAKSHAQQHIEAPV
ncbi:hypothetical protein B7486_03165 [cyanobacterium TDX16]|nr:hypothetical protein B7486_03165 [cyanobacterium TDX16]